MFSEFPLQIEEAPSANFDQGCFLTHVLTTVKRNEKRLVQPKRQCLRKKDKEVFLFKQFRKLERSTFPHQLGKRIKTS